MNDGLRPYTDYKDSGLPCLGKVPAHWDVRRNGRLFAQRNETGFGDLPILEVSLKTGVRVRDMENLKRKQMMSDREKYKRAVRGDVAYNMMRLWQGAVGVAPVDGLVSPAYVVARPYDGTDTRYFSYLFRTAAYMAEIDGYSRGIVKDRNRLYWDDFKRMPSCYPPPEEQSAIVNYLDANAVLVRKFIRNRRRLIEVLIEQKQAIVNRAVTHGLGFNVALKPSNLDWHPDVPEHWAYTRLKNVAHVQTGITLGKDYGQKTKQPFPYLRVANVQAGRLDLRVLKHVEIPESEARGCMLQAGDVLMTEGGDIDKLGRGCVWHDEVQECVHQNHVFAVRCHRPLLPEFLVALMSSAHGRAYFQSTAKQTTNLASTNSSTLRAFPFFLPPGDEQAAILEWAAAHTSDLAAAINRAEREIDLIRDYRTRLIADVVTGKLDVRYLAPPPESLEVEELAGIEADESLDDESAEEDADLVEESSDADD